MGYCNRCGDIINGSKCRKCGGKPVESLAKGAVDPKSSVVDRWQNQYANSILSGPEPVGTTSTPSKMKRNSIACFTSSYNTRSPSSVSVQPKTCILCHKAVPLGTQLGKNDYCHECRVKISNNKSSPSITNSSEATTIECMGCSQPVNPEQPKVQHQGRAWHQGCIRCSLCLNPLPNPTALDLHGSSRCLSCQEKQRPTNKVMSCQQPQAATSPTSTVSSSISSASRFSPIPRSLQNDKYGSTTSISTFGGDSTSSDTLSTRKKSMDGINSSIRPRLDSQLFQQYQKSLNQQPPLSPLLNGPVKPTRSLSSQLSSTSLSSYNERPRMAISSSTTTTSSSTQQKSRQRRSSFTPDKPPSTKKTCRKCMQVLRGPRVRLPTPTGDTWYYHYDCLTCAACGDHFTESEFVGDGKDVFHLHCRTPSPAQSTSPPPLSPTTSLSSDPISPSISPIPAATKLSSSSTSTPYPPKSRERCLSNASTQQQQPLDYRCHTCCLPIEDKCLKNGTRFFHPNCFTCFSCHEHLPSDRPFYDIQQEAHCEICTKLIIKTGSTVRTGSVADRRKSMPNGPSPTTLTPLSPSSSSPLVAWNEEKGDTPSRIWMQRTRVLPKLGGSKICPGCNKSIAVMDDTPGPRASRWHKKCLKCTGCKKQMDSGAKVTEADQKWLVRCSDCSDKNPKPHYVR
ncbi:hypothetical protein BC941DRAFT_467904 [Chlamydoabsidia padenii]|nr:hypothetical protein BC941DRAFT_467904 [Chlamydoabsidia padenii]